MKYIFITIFLFTLLSCNFHLNRFQVTSSSMSPALNPGDIIKIDKQSRNFDYGDIISCHQIEYEYQEISMVSRIVGLPGDSIKVKYDFCIINGIDIDNRYKIKQRSKLTEHKTSYDEYEEIFPNGKSILIYHSSLDERDETITETIKVPKDHFYIMEDHRSNSIDSRHFGTIHRSKIIGKVIKITSGNIL